MTFVNIEGNGLDQLGRVIELAGAQVAGCGTAVSRMSAMGGKRTFRTLSLTGAHRQFTNVAKTTVRIRFSACKNIASRIS